MAGGQRCDGGGGKERGRGVRAPGERRGGLCAACGAGVAWRCGAALCGVIEDDAQSSAPASIISALFHRRLPAAIVLPLESYLPKSHCAHPPAPLPHNDPPLPFAGWYLPRRRAARQRCRPSQFEGAHHARSAR